MSGLSINLLVTRTCSLLQNDRTMRKVWTLRVQFGKDMLNANPLQNGLPSYLPFLSPMDHYKMNPISYKPPFIKKNNQKHPKACRNMFPADLLYPYPSTSIHIGLFIQIHPYSSVSQGTFSAFRGRHSRSLATLRKIHTVCSRIRHQNVRSLSMQGR